MSTKKQPKAADLPVKSTAAPAQPKRARTSRVKAARAVAKAEANGDWSKVNDQQIDLATPALTTEDFALPVASREEIVAREVLAIQRSIDANLVDRDNVLGKVADEVREAFLEYETKAAVAALDVDPEVVRSLSDLDDNTDPFGFDDMPADINAKDEVAAARLDDEFAEQVGNSVWDFVADAEERASVRLKMAQAHKLELDNSQRQPPEPVSDDNYETMNAQYDRIRELDEQIKEAQRDLHHARHTIQVHETEFSLKVEHLKTMATDLEDARNGLIAANAELDDLRIALKRQRDLNARYCRAIDAASVRAPFLARVAAVFVDPNKGAR